MNKKSKINPKYSEVKSVLNTGKTMKDVNIASDNLIAKKKGENFGRVNPSTLAKFISDTNNTEESVFGLMKQSDDKENFDTQSVAESIYSVGKESTCSAVTCTTDMLGVTSETKFILLDLRDEDEYKAFHIKESINFPAPNITRDKTFSQLLRFKNLPDKLIVIYMSDERQGTHYAKLLFEKGFDNVYLLSGGVKKFLETNYDLVEGNKVPEKTQEKKGTVKKSTTASIANSTTQSIKSVMGKSTTSFKK